MTALGMGPLLRMELRLECAVCLHQNRADEVQDNASALALCGAADDPYAVCPSCYREIPEPARAGEPYRLRVRRHYFARGIVLHKDATGRWLKRRIDA